MSLWWVQKDDLDTDQLALIEELPLQENCLILGPPGSGKTNVLLRRAQFVRSQDITRVLVLGFTRSLTEFTKTGCLNFRGQELFPRECVVTIEEWIRSLYERHSVSLPNNDGDDLVTRKRRLAAGALGFLNRNYLPKYDILFVDESQDLLTEEVNLMRQWSPVLCFVGDDRQKIHSQTDGLDTVRRVKPLKVYTLKFHYRLAPEICRVADRILVPQGGGKLEDTSHYDGPRPGTVEMHGPRGRVEQMRFAASKLRQQIRVYADLIERGDKLGIIVGRKESRDEVHEYIENDPNLSGLSKIIRARKGNRDHYDPSIDPKVQICILTVKGCKGLEFRAVHWLFCDELQHHQSNEDYYTVVTRAKTSIDFYFENNLPQPLTEAYSEPVKDLWR